MAPDRFLSRLGALLTAPRRLARRDLARHDGKGVDDLVLVALVALVATGAARLITAAGAIAAGRYNTAIRRVLEVLQPAGPWVVLWILATLTLMAFTWKTGRRVVGELAARVVTGAVLANVLVTLVSSHLPPGGARFAIESVPWAITALLFGLVLRESLEAAPDGEPVVAPTFGPGARYLGVFLVALLGFAGVHHALEGGVPAQATIEARRGAPAPPIDLPLLDPRPEGGRLDLAALRGKRVVMTFWATWCHPCMEELPALERAYRARGSDGALVYAINVDEPGAAREGLVRQVVSRFGLTFPIALDDGSAGHAYSVATIPTLVRVERDGKLLGVSDRPLDEPELLDALRP